MATIDNSILLQDNDIIREINSYKWIESEKAGYDIGFERASREWISTYSEKYFIRHPNKTSLFWIKSQPFYKLLNKQIL